MSPYYYVRYKNLSLFLWLVEHSEDYVLRVFYYDVCEIYFSALLCQQSKEYTGEYTVY